MRQACMRRGWRLARVLLTGWLLLSCNGTREEREAILKQDLTALRSVLPQFVVDLHRRPESWNDLIKNGYLKEIPQDPITGRRDTWHLVMNDVGPPPNRGIIDIHSGSDHKASDGRRYSEW